MDGEFQRPGEGETRLLARLATPPFSSSYGPLPQQDRRADEGHQQQEDKDEGEEWVDLWEGFSWGLNSRSGR